MKIKLVLTDIDGVWTDGGMYYDQTGNELKKFNTSDSAGVLFLNILEIPVGIITGEDTQIVANRAKKLNIPHVFQGVKNKLEVATKLCNDLGISLTEVAYIGDDITDLHLLQAVGYSAAPANAPDYVKKKVKYSLKTKGGDGAFREFIETLINEQGDFKAVLDQYLQDRK